MIYQMTHIPEEAVEAAGAAFKRELMAHGILPHADWTAEIITSALEAALPFLNQLRTVATVEELEALPVGSVLRDRYGHLCAREQRDGQPVISAVGWSTLTDAIDYGAPFTVIHEER